MLFRVENNCIYHAQQQTYHLTTRFPHAPETDQRLKYAMQAEKSKTSGVECALKKKLKKLTCNVPCVRFSQRRANRWWQGLQHEKLCPAGCVTIAGTQFAFIWSWVDTFFAVCCLQRLPELLPRDENATPPIPENRAHGLPGLCGKRMDRNLSLWCSFQTTWSNISIGKQKRNSLVLWSGSTAALATRNRATVQSPLFGKKWDFYESLSFQKRWT